MIDLKKNLHWIIYLLFIASCAKQTSPTGGPKDTIPPVLVNSNPAKGTINFKGDKLNMEFSEMIILANPKEQLIITPTIGKDFEMTNKKNTVILTFNAPLEDSTTYTFNFRDAVQDITEKNPVRNLQIAISTGPWIDSLSVAGTVFDLLTNKPVSDALVALHLPNDTVSILKHPATYFTKSNKEGNYRIDNLKPGSYYIYSIQDKNKNLFADSRTESYGFHTEPIVLEKDTASVNLHLVKLDTRPLKVISARPYNTYFNIKTTKNMTDFSLSSIDSLELYYGFGEDRANIRIYNNMYDRDSIALNLVAFDSIGNKLDSTVYAKFSGREVEAEKFITTLQQASLLGDKGLFEARLTFTKPIRDINFDSLLFRIDSTTQIKFLPDDISYKESTKTLTIKKAMDKNLFVRPNQEQQRPQKTVPEDSTAKSTPKKKLNELFIGKGTFMSIENDTSQRIVQKVDPLYTDQLSVIIFELNTTEENFIVQVVDKNLQVVQEIKNTSAGQFQNLKPDQYFVRVIIDKNGNGVWDPGNYYEKEEPEKIIYYIQENNSPTINLKANWEFELAPMLITS